MLAPVNKKSINSAILVLSSCRTSPYGSEICKLINVQASIKENEEKKIKN